MSVPFVGACKPKEDTGLSGGSVLLIIFFVSVTVYLVVGVTYNIFIEKKSGYNVIPHYKIWSFLMISVIVSFCLFIKNIQWECLRIIILFYFSIGRNRVCMEKSHVPIERTSAYKIWRYLIFMAIFNGLNNFLKRSLNKNLFLI